ncbi:Cytochrome b5 [Conglomerata obtusa]
MQKCNLTVLVKILIYLITICLLSKKMQKLTWKTIKQKKYIVIKNKVYDVASFKERHPGGSQMIEDWMGKDATQVFLNVGHTEHAHNLLKDFYVGDLDLTSNNSENYDYTIIGIGVGLFALIISYLYYRLILK